MISRHLPLPPYVHASDRYEDLLDARRLAETLQLVATFLYSRAAPADGASPEAAASALRGMLDRVQVVEPSINLPSTFHQPSINLPSTFHDQPSINLP